MGDVVELKPKDDDTGYLLTGKKVDGVYVHNIAAMINYDNVYLGTKGDDGIDDALLTNLKDMDRFCIMWLGINNPDVLKGEDE